MSDSSLDFLFAPEPEPGPVPAVVPQPEPQPPVVVPSPPPEAGDGAALPLPEPAAPAAVTKPKREVRSWRYRPTKDVGVIVVCVTDRPGWEAEEALRRYLSDHQHDKGFEGRTFADYESC